jgi:plastocyanin
MTKTLSRRVARTGAVAAMAVLAAACGGSGDGTRTVTAADYSFQDLPKSVDAGTTFTFRNSSTKELHEMVMIRIPDSEKRPVSELVRLPESEQNAIFGTAEPAMVLLAGPNGGEMIKAVGDGKVTEKGRYAVVCFIPTGVDPAVYLAAAQASTGGPPNIPNAGPPHAVQGMFGEITVK